jgi:uncharacterized protein involved in exopolysaccharide biosynthesis
MPTRTTAEKKTTPKRAPARKAAAKPEAKKVAAKPMRAGASVAGIAAATLDSIETLQKLKQNLEAVRLKLRNVDTSELDAAGLAARTDQLSKVADAIEAARNALLGQIADAFEAELPGLQSSTGKLAASLARLNKAAEVVTAVAGVLGVIERIVTLGGGG